MSENLLHINYSTAFFFKFLFWELLQSSGSQLGQFCLPGDICLETFWLSQLGGQQMKMLLNILKFTGQSPTTIRWSQMPIVEKPLPKVWNKFKPRRKFPT